MIIVRLRRPHQKRSRLLGRIMGQVCGTRLRVHALRFETRQRAQAAADEIKKNHPGIEAWVAEEEWA